ncbi:MAG: DUF1657 domain-containing protein [Limnochordia bacterium]|jgi:hypothetical protein|nr:DUF1657 domain-containing protein [Bacillota bacterium]
MTVASRLKQTIAAAEGVGANLKSFSLETDDENMSRAFDDLASEVDDIIAKLKGRLGHVQDQEPQYRS